MERAIGGGVAGLAGAVLLGCVPRVVTGPALLVEAREPVSWSREDHSRSTVVATLELGSADDPVGAEGAAWAAVHRAVHPLPDGVVSVELEVGRLSTRVQWTCEDDVSCVDAAAGALLEPALDDPVSLPVVDEPEPAEVWTRVVYRAHPWGHPVTGWGELCAPPAVVSSLLRSHLVRAAVRLSGDLSEEERDRLLSRLEALPARPLPERVVWPPEPLPGVAVGPYPGSGSWLVHGSAGSLAPDVVGPVESSALGALLDEVPEGHLVVVATGRPQLVSGILEETGRAVVHLTLPAPEVHP